MKKPLSKEQIDVMEKKGTEAPFSSSLLQNKKEGFYVCAACKNNIFESKTKFDSGTGWPSFYDAIKGNVGIKEDNSLGMKRKEAICSRCKSHLGHVFDDGPLPTRKRYCINGVALNFKEKNEK